MAGARCALLALSLSSLAHSAVGGKGDGDEPFSSWNGQEYIFVGELLVVIVLSLCFEAATDWLREFFKSLGSQGKSMQMMMDCVTKEIMILGFIGLLVYVSTKTDLALALARDIYPEGMVGEENPLTETFETVHMMIFCVMMCFILQGGTLMYKCYGEAAKWKQWEGMVVHHGLQSQTTIASMMREEGYLTNLKQKSAGTGEGDGDSSEDDEDDTAKKFQDHIASLYSVNKKIESVHSPIRRLFKQGGVLGVLEWRAIRHDFMFPAIRCSKRAEFDNEIGNMYKPEEPQFFNFHEYLTSKLGCEFVDLMEVDLSTWIAASVLSLMLPKILSAGEEWYATIAACGSWAILLMFLGFTVHVFHVYIQLSIPLPNDPLTVLKALRGTGTVGLQRKAKQKLLQHHRTKTLDDLAPMLSKTPEARVFDLEQEIRAADKRLAEVAKDFGISGFRARSSGLAASPMPEPSPRDLRSEDVSFAERFKFKSITLNSLKTYERPRYMKTVDRCYFICDRSDEEKVLHPTYQDQLFLFHEHGPWIMKKAFELLIFLQSICMASFIVIWLTLEEWTPYQYSVVFFGAAAPAINLWWLVPRLVSKFAIVTSIDFKKDIALCESIMSANKKKQIMETLRLLKIARMEGKIERLNKRTLTEQDKRLYLDEYHDYFPASKKTQFEHMFHVFDADGSGSISLREMRKALIGLGIPEDSSLVTGAERVMELIDVDGSKTIELEEFQTLLAMAFLKAEPEDQKADMEYLFQKIDADNTGFLSIEELALAFDGLGVSVSTDDMAELVYQVFLSFKQQLSLQEFGDFMEGLEAKFSE